MANLIGNLNYLPNATITDTLAGTTQVGDVLWQYSQQTGVLTINGIEEVPPLAPPFPLPGGGSVLGGDYTALLDGWATPLGIASGLTSAMYNITFPSSTLTPTGSTNTIFGDIVGVNLVANEVAHNGPFPDNSPPLEYVGPVNTDPSFANTSNPWNGISYEPFYTVIQGVNIHFGNDTINAANNVNYTIAGNANFVNEIANCDQSVSGVLYPFTNNSANLSGSIPTGGQDSESIIQNCNITGGSTTINVNNSGTSKSPLANTVAGNFLTVTVEAINTATNLDSMGHLATSSSSNGIYGLASAQPVISNGNLAAPVDSMDMGNNTINVSGNYDVNNIYGNIQTYQEMSINKTQTLEAFGSVINFNTYQLGGTNTITVSGNSTNTISGDVGDVRITSQSANAGTSSQTAGFTSGAGAGTFESYLFGSNTINASASSGTNTIYGEGHSFIETMTVGNVDPSGKGWGVGYYGGPSGNYHQHDNAHAFISNNSIGAVGEGVTAGPNTIIGGTGNNTLVGDFGLFELSLTAGNVGSSNDYIAVTAGDPLPANPSFVGDAGANASARLSNSNFIMGDNTLIANGGGVNKMIGGVETLEFDLTQGHIGKTGDVGYGLFDAANHHIGTFASFGGNRLADPTSPFSSFHIDHGDHFVFGNNTLDASATTAKGTDYLIGNTLGVSDQSLQNFLTNPSALITEGGSAPTGNPPAVGTINLNTIEWGNDVLSGGAGVNHFDSLVATNADLYGAANAALLGAPVLQLLGNVEITNLATDGGKNSLEFYSPVGSNTNLNLAFLEAHTHFALSGANTIITFDGGGTMQLDGVNNINLSLGFGDTHHFFPSYSVNITNDLGVIGNEHGTAFKFIP